jgi:hypothetical protein
MRIRALKLLALLMLAGLNAGPVHSPQAMAEGAYFKGWCDWCQDVYGTVYRCCRLSHPDECNSVGECQV